MTQPDTTVPNPVSNPALNPASRSARLLYALRLLYLLLTFIFALLLALQVFFAGLGVLVSPAYFAWHVQLGHMLSLPIFALFIVGLVSLIGWRGVLIPVLLFVLYGLQYAFLEGLEGPLRALHAVNALLLFWLATQLIRLAWRKAWVLRPVAGVPRASLGRTLVGGVMVLVGAVVLFGAFFDDGPGLNVALPVSTRATPEGAEAAPEPLEAADSFAQNCSSCHGAAGEGGFGPALAANDDLQDTDAVLEQVLGGGGGMPAFGRRLSDAEVAALVSHVRASWGNRYTAVTHADVAAAR